MDWKSESPSHRECISRQCDRKCNGQKIATASAEVHGSGRVSSATCGVSEKSNAVNSASLLREEEMRVMNQATAGSGMCHALYVYVDD